MGFLLGTLYSQSKESNKTKVCKCGVRLLNQFNSTLLAWFSLIFGITITSVIIFSVKSSYGCETDCWSLTHSAFYVAFSHSGFAFALMVVLLPLLFGRLSWLKSFLSWGAFRVIARLTYCAYLVHYVFITMYMVSLNNSNYISKDNVVFHYFGLYCMSYLCALGLALIIEVPFTRLEKLLRELYGSDEKRTKNGEIEFVELRQT